MKYHSPIRIVILSLIIVLTFSFISLSSIFLFSAKSATELIVSSAFERLAEGDDISISFSSLDRNIRGNITLNDVDLAVRGESILNIERVRLSTSFFSLIRSFFGANGVFNVDFYSPRISIGEEVEIDTSFALLRMVLIRSAAVLVFPACRYASAAIR